MKFEDNEHPHRRYNPLTGEHVLVSPHRAKRPWAGYYELHVEESVETEPGLRPGCGESTFSPATSG